MLLGLGAVLEKIDQQLVYDLVILGVDLEAGVIQLLPCRFDERETMGEIEDCAHTP